MNLSMFHTIPAVFVDMLSLLLCVLYWLAFTSCSLLLLYAFLPLVCFDEAGVLDDAFFDRVAFGV